MTQATRTERTRSLPPALAAYHDRLASGPAWLRERRSAARARFETLGFPTSRLEEWKSTSVAEIARTPFEPAPDRRDGVTRDALSRLGWGAGTRLVLVNGRFAPALSQRGELPGGAWAGGLAEALASGTQAGLLEARLGRYASHPERAFTALNDAFLEDGAVLVLPDGATLDEPVEILHLTATDGVPFAAHARTLVLAGANSRAVVLETFAVAGNPAGRYLNNAVTEIAVGHNATVEHHRLQREGQDASHVGALAVRQERDSRFTAHNFDFGAALSRLDTVAVLDGEGGECVLNGLYMPRGRQHVDNHTTLDHARPHCQSRELYKGVLADQSRAVFNGRIIVRQDAQKTDAKQSNPNLLLSDAALVNTRPQLEIYADDVKCTHGATIGRLDDEAHFYLRSRGIGSTDARNMLIRAFAGEVLGRVRVERLRETLEREIAGRLGNGGPAAASGGRVPR